MYGVEYLDESYIEQCEKMFRIIYREFKFRVIGASMDRMHVIIECEFPDGTFYFRVDENSVSQSYNTKEDADRG